MEIKHKRRRRLHGVAAQFLLGIAGLAAITFVCFEVGLGVSSTAFAYLILVALLSLLGSFSTSVVLSLLAVACLNYFFVPPLFDFRVDDPDDIMRMAAFLAASLIVTALTAKRKRAEQELAESRYKLQEAQRIAHVGWWERDFTTKRVTLSDEVCRIFGLEPVDLPEWHGRWLTLIHPEDRPRAEQAAAAALLPGGPRYDLEYRVVRRDGTERVVHSQGDVTWDEAGRPLRQFGVLQDITELRQAEQELRASEARFRTIVDYATDAFFVFDDNSTVVDVNREACESLGYSREELIGKHRSDFDAGLDEASIQRLKQRIVTGEPITFETRHRRKDGTTFPVEVRVGDFEQGGARRFLCLVRDITERKQAEEALRRNETYLAAAESLSKMGSWAWRPAANEITHWSQGRYRLFGFDPADGLPSLEAVIERIHPEDRALWLENRSLVASGGESDFDFRIVLPDGGTKHVHAVGRPIINQSGEVVEVMGAAADISERKRAEQGLRDSEERFRTLVQFSFDAYWETDAQHRFVRQEFASPADGFQNSAIGKTRWEAPYLEPDEEGWRKHREILEAHLPFRDFEIARPTPDGGKRYFSVSGLPIFDSEGRFTGYRGVGREITERKRAEEELRASEERFRTLVQFSFDVYWESDAQHRFVRQEFTEGLADAPAAGSEIGKTRWEVPYLEPDEEAWRKHRATLDAHLPFRDFELARPTPDGGKRYVSVSGLPVFDKSGRFIGYRGVGRHTTERKRAEEALRASEERFRTLMQFSFEVYWETDAQHRLVRQELPEDLVAAPVPWAEIGKTRWEVAYLEPDEEGWRKHREALDAHVPFRDFELARPTADGGKEYISVSGLPLFDKTGRFMGYRGVARHITERKQAEEALRRSEAYLAESQKLSHTGTWAFNQTETLYWSEETYVIAGLDPRQGLPSRQAVRHLTHPGDRDRVDEALTNALARKKNFAIEFRLLLPDGTVKYVESTGHPVFSARGEFLEIIGSIIDVTERRRAQEELRRSESYLADTQRLSHTGTTVFDATGPVYWSEESYRIWGFDPLQGLPDRATLLARIHPDDRDRMNEQFQKPLDEKRHFSFEFRIVLPDGTLKYIESTGHPLLSTDGELVEMLATHVDVTERKRAQQEHARLRQLESELAHVNRVSMMGELTASLAHEILHPIATARNNARAAMRFLDMKPPNLIEVKDALACIVRDADRGKDIVDRVRAHVKKSPLRTDCFDLNEAIREVIEMVRAAIDKNRVSVRTRLAPDLSLVMGDRVQLQQVVMNLLLNAVESMASVEERARVLSLSTEQNGDGGVLVAVKDSGPGIDPEHLEQVFERFYTTKETGVGMGLAICRSIISAHGGRLWAEANRPRGAVFQFTLPAAQEDS